MLSIWSSFRETGWSSTPNGGCTQGRTKGSLPGCPQAGGGLLGRGGNPCVVTQGSGELPAAEVVWQQNDFVRS